VVMYSAKIVSVLTRKKKKTEQHEILRNFSNSLNSTVPAANHGHVPLGSKCGRSCLGAVVCFACLHAVCVAWLSVACVSWVPVACVAWLHAVCVAWPLAFQHGRCRAHVQWCILLLGMAHVAKHV
jgi:hypothetical protein